MLTKVDDPCAHADPVAQPAPAAGSNAAGRSMMPSNAMFGPLQSSVPSRAPSPSPFGGDLSSPPVTGLYRQSFSSAAPPGSTFIAAPIGAYFNSFAPPLFRGAYQPSTPHHNPAHYGVPEPMPAVAPASAEANAAAVRRTAAMSSLVPRPVAAGRAAAIRAHLAATSMEADFSDVNETWHTVVASVIAAIKAGTYRQMHEQRTHESELRLGFSHIGVGQKTYDAFLHIETGKDRARMRVSCLNDKRFVNFFVLCASKTPPSTSRQPSQGAAFSSLSSRDQHFAGALLTAIMEIHTGPAVERKQADGAIVRRFDRVMVEGREWEVATREHGTPTATELKAKSDGTFFACQISATDRVPAQTQASSAQGASPRDTLASNKRKAGTPDDLATDATHGEPSTKRTTLESRIMASPAVELGAGDLDQAMQRLSRTQQLDAICELYKKHVKHAPATQANYINKALIFFQAWDRNGGAPMPYTFLRDNPLDFSGLFKAPFARNFTVDGLHKSVQSFRTALKTEAEARRNQKANATGTAVSSNTPNPGPVTQ